MHSTYTSCLKFRRGTSTILGTIIFIGIMFTAVIPMFLVIKQADTLFEQSKYELGILDEGRMDEEVYVYIFPVTEASTTLTLQVHNRGHLVVNVVQLWINNDPHLLDDFVVQPMSLHEMVLDESTVGFTPVPDTRYFIKITTDRGNIFSSNSGSLYFDSEENWDEGMFGINFLISYPAAGWFEVFIENSGNPVPDTPFFIHKSSAGVAFAFCPVPTATTYDVIIMRGTEEIYNDEVTISWPNGPAIEMVIA